MNPYRIGKVVYHNFLGFEHVEVDFSQPGLTVVLGPNGAGKSALIEGIVWALFDRLMRPKWNGDDVCRTGADTGTYVCVDLVGQGHTVRVCRYRKDAVCKNHVYLYVNGEEVGGGTTPMINQSILNELGMDFDSFVNAVAFGARDDVRGFFAATDSDRKQVLEGILGLGLFGEAQQVAKKRLKAVMAESDTVSAGLAAAEAHYEASRRMYAKYGHEDAVEHRQVDLARAKAMRTITERRLKGAQARLKFRQQQTAAELLSYLTASKAYEVALKKYEAELAELKERMAEGQKKLGLAEWNAGAKGDLIDDISKLGPKCPKCLQPVSKKHTEKAVAELKAEAAKHGTEADALLMELEILKQQEASMAPPALMSTEAYEAAKVVEAKAEGVVTLAQSRATQALNAYKAAEKEYETAASEMALAQSSLAERQQEVYKLEARRLELEEAATVKSFWVEGFGNAGLKSFLIEAELPAINKATADYALAFMGNGAYVRLTATKETKKGEVKEEIGIEAGIPGCAQAYAGASKGQKVRMNLSLMLGLWRLLSSRAVRAFDQFFADEIFDGVDRAGVEAVSAVLQEMAATRPVVLVTHDEQLKGIGDRMLWVEHDGTQSNVTQQFGFTSTSKPAKVSGGGAKQPVKLK